MASTLMMKAAIGPGGNGAPRRRPRAISAASAEGAAGAPVVPAGYGESDDINAPPPATAGAAPGRGCSGPALAEGRIRARGSGYHTQARLARRARGHALRLPAGGVSARQGPVRG